MAFHLVVRFGKETVQLLLKSLRSEVFKLEELYLKDGLEWPVIDDIGKRLHIHFSGLLRDRSVSQ